MTAATRSKTPWESRVNLEKYFKKIVDIKIVKCYYTYNISIKYELKILWKENKIMNNEYAALSAMNMMMAMCMYAMYMLYCASYSELFSSKKRLILTSRLV